jgi:hypothetical protein
MKIYLASGGAAAGFGSLLLIIILVGCYFIPAIVAWVRHVPNAGSVTVINFFLGWTLVGYVVALAMACRSQPVAVVVNQNQYHLPPPPPGT